MVGWRGETAAKEKGMIWGPRKCLNVNWLHHLINRYRPTQRRNAVLAAASIAMSD
jgi:hypothetical protein